MDELLARRTSGSEADQRLADARAHTSRTRPARGAVATLEHVAVSKSKVSRSGLAQPHRLFEHRVEYRREVAGRGIDDLQYLGGRGLLLQRLARLGESRAFSIAMTACAAKFCKSAICFSENGRTSWR